jgi:GTPase SAR1 family protein
LDRVRSDFDFSKTIQTDPRPVLVILVNKIDSPYEETVLETMRRFAAENDMLFFPVSARTGEGIRESLDSIARSVASLYLTEGVLDCLVVGDREVGKTNLVSRFFLESFSDGYQPTTDCDRRSKFVSIGQ